MQPGTKGVIVKRNFFLGVVFNWIDAKEGSPERLIEVRGRKDLRAQKGPKHEIPHNACVAWNLFNRGA